jgi:hypothetical protein
MTARGEMTMEQPSADTLKVMFSGQWKLRCRLAKPPRETGHAGIAERPDSRALEVGVGRMFTRTWRHLLLWSAPLTFPG